MSAAQPVGLVGTGPTTAARPTSTRDHPTPTTPTTAPAWAPERAETT